ncbi:DUF4235 domain-containing protein [Patulibacter minatonensis]|uniref:DUF4235 domain-containing protein n=1 Tax=Patulibacter minatonensis TaxID=298163 RepID=UPI00047A5929|nr:DUF4235 domain-containing protein [Patulibacter minatonensis]
MKLLYKPLGIAFGVLGGLAGGALFKQVWKRVAGEEDAPGALQSEYGWAQIIPAAALQGAIFGAVKAATDRAGAKAFERVTGEWPGD